MKPFSKPFNLQNSLSLPEVTKRYLEDLGVEESCVVYYDDGDKIDIPETIYPIDEILSQHYDCVAPAWGDYLLVRKGKYCGVVNGGFGALIIDTIYLTIIPPINCHNFAVQNKNGEWGVLKTNETDPIVGFGKYKYLWGFDDGLCLVATFTNDNLTFSNRGIIDKRGKEVVSPYTYTDIYRFYGQNTNTITFQKGNLLQYRTKEDLTQVVSYEQIQLTCEIFEEDGKYGIKDINGKCVIPCQYDIILGIYENSYAIVGMSTFLSNRSDFSDYGSEGYTIESFHSYKYGIISLSNEILFPIIYESIFVKNNMVYASFLRDSPVYCMTMLRQYIWKTKRGNRYVDIHSQEVVGQTDELIILKCLAPATQIKEASGMGISFYQYKVLTLDGKVIKETRNKDDLVPFLPMSTHDLYFKMPEYKKMVGNPHVTLKWKRFTSNIQDNKYTLYFDGSVVYQVNMPCDNFVLNDSFLLIQDETYKTICIFSNSGKILVEDKNGIIYEDMGWLYESIIINKTYILDSNGNRYQLKKELRGIGNFHTDKMGYLPFCVRSTGKIEKFNGIGFYYDGDKFGYMDKFGEIVIPPIFPCPIKAGSYTESHNKKHSCSNLLDAYDGESDLLWNTD